MFVQHLSDSQIGSWLGVGLFIAAATRLSACCTACRGSSTKPTWIASHRARKSVAASAKKSGAACSSIAGAVAVPAPADETPSAFGAVITHSPGRTAAPARAAVLSPASVSPSFILFNCPLDCLLFVSILNAKNELDFYGRTMLGNTKARNCSQLHRCWPGACLCLHFVSIETWYCNHYAIRKLK